MLDKIKKIYTTLKGTVPAIKLSGSPSGFVRTFATIMIFSILLYLSLFILAVFADYKVELVLKSLIRLEVFIPIIAGAAVVTAVSSIGKLLIDKNKNGIPDAFEDEEGKK